jgi:hypothetical protein
MTPPVRCSTLVPADWREGVPGVAIPAPVPTTWGDVICAAVPVEYRGMCAAGQRALEGERRYSAAYVGESGQRQKANGRTVDSLGIVGACETLINEARPGG